MRPRWVNLNEQDRISYRATVAFLNGRLEEQGTIDWALGLKPNNTIMRIALLDVIDSPAGQKIAEPWRSAWRLIDESWNDTEVEDSSISAYDVQRRLRGGDRSGALVTRIVDLVSPRLEIEPFSKLHLHYRKPPRWPKKIEDLFSAGLKSGKDFDPNLLELGGLSDRSFLLSLVLGLDAAVNKGLDIACRIGWVGEGKLWQLGGLHRVYYVPVTERSDGDNEPDIYHRGIAPSVKLLHAVVSRLLDVASQSAIELVRRWKFTDSPIHIRLWAALSKDSRVTPAKEVGEFLLSLNDRRFWNLHDFPEISELRAKRFGELELREQIAITARIRKRPPRNQWSRRVDTKHVSRVRFYWAVREMRRIEVAGASLPARDKTWMDVCIIREFPELAQMNRLDEGFLVSAKASWVPPNPDNQYDLLAREERLKALEVTLSVARRGWDDDPAERAADWIRQIGRPVQILADLESVPRGGAAFARVWERFGWAHSLGEQGEEATRRDLSAESARVLSLLVKLPESTIRQAIDGISHWLSVWEKQVVVLAEGPTVWFKVWPVAVETTNAKQPDVREASINTVVQSSNDLEPMDLDTLNTPTGKLVGVFLTSCPNLQVNSRPFDFDVSLRRMRDATIAATGRSGLIARHRMIEALPYFLHADPDWTHEHLITPLIADNMEAIVLWRAIARRTHFSEVLKIIGGPMVERATDQRLGRETRRSLVFSLVIECLHAFREHREPAVPCPRIQQMIRSLDDEVRAYGVEAVQRFVRDVSAAHDGEQASPTPEQLFRSAAAPFLQKVWPQERSLATPGVSRALADLPATVGEAFAEAVEIIERFLVPFECWSMIDYGLYGKEDGEPRLSSIDNPEKAAALLRLLDRTIGTSEGSVIPHDLADALDQVSRIAPNLADTQGLRRLATAARRG